MIHLKYRKKCLRHSKINQNQTDELVFYFYSLVIQSSRVVLWAITGNG